MLVCMVGGELCGCVPVCMCVCVGGGGGAGLCVCVMFAGASHFAAVTCVSFKFLP